MKKKGNVTIGPEFFKKARLDYSNWHWALIREFMQNSIDCRSKRIDVTVTCQKGKTVLRVRNNGEPMTEEILVGKLLSLGSSGKDFRGSVGGFGKAKELLYFCWDSYSIRSGRLLVEGSGADYELTRGLEDFHGTDSQVIIDGDCADALEAQAVSFVSLSNVNTCVFTVNKKTVDLRVRRGYFRREMPFGRIYTNKQVINLMVVRIGGTPMFTAFTKYDGCVVLELSGVSSDALTSNRDGLQYKHRAQMEGFLADLMVNKNKALKQKVTEYRHFKGEKIKSKTPAGFEAQRAKVAARQATQTKEALAETGPALNLATATRGDDYNSGDLVLRDTGVQTSETARRLASEFVIKNELGRAIKPQYLPDSPKFSKYAYRLVLIWSELLLKVHEVLGFEDDFGVGFVFTEDDVAQYEKSPDYGKVYYINPVVIEGRKWHRRFSYSINKARGDLNQLVMTALHEVVHGMGYHDHDENYAGKLTDTAAVLLGYVRDLIKCFGAGK